MTRFSLAHAAGEVICQPMSEVWFILVDSDGQPYEDTAAGKAVVDPKADIPVCGKLSRRSAQAFSITSRTYDSKFTRTGMFSTQRGNL